MFHSDRPDAGGPPILKSFAVFFGLLSLLAQGCILQPYLPPQPAALQPPLPLFTSPASSRCFFGPIVHLFEALSAKHASEGCRENQI